MRLKAAALAATTVVAAAPAPAMVAGKPKRRNCGKLFTVKMGKRAANAIYDGDTNDGTRKHLRLLGYIERCQRNPAAQAFVRSYDRARSKFRITPVVGAVGAGGWAIPEPIVMCESGGQNLPPNSAGASGYYQIIPSTWGGFGGYIAAYLAPKSVQDAKASILWDGGRGTSQWTCARMTGYA